MSFWNWVLGSDPDFVIIVFFMCCLSGCSVVESESCLFEEQFDL